MQILGKRVSEAHTTTISDRFYHLLEGEAVVPGVEMEVFPVGAGVTVELSVVQSQQKHIHYHQPLHL